MAIKTATYVSPTYQSTREYKLLRASVTSREREVLMHMSSGQTSLEIATAMYISEHTVITHRKNLLNKLGARNTAQLIMKSVRIGILR